MAFRTDETELAIIDTSRSDADAVTAISARLLKARACGDPLTIDGIPFDLRVV